MNYYNEISKFKAAWLRGLITAGLIPPGEVDERSISDVQPGDLHGYSQCHFFAGIAGWSYALSLAEWPESRNVWTGSCPCPSYSVAGQGRGFSDARHLWPAWIRLIRECRPATILGEQVAAAIGYGWLDLVQTDLEAEGYAVGKAVLPACCVGANHRRDRLWFVAHPERDQQPRQESRHGEIGRVGRVQQPVPWNRDWESALREFRVMDDGISYGVEAVDAPRDAIVPQVAAEFIGAYLEATRCPVSPSSRKPARNWKSVAVGTESKTR